MTNERLTDQQITDTCDAMNMPTEHSEAIKSRALSGDAAARFVVFGARRSLADRAAAVAAWAAQPTH